MRYHAHLGAGERTAYEAGKQSCFYPETEGKTKSKNKKNTCLVRQGQGLVGGR